MYSISVYFNIFVEDLAAVVMSWYYHRALLPSLITISVDVEASLSCIIPDFTWDKNFILGVILLSQASAMYKLPL